MQLSTVIFVCVAVVGVACAVAYYLARVRRGRFRMDIGGQAPRATGGEDTSTETGFKQRLLGLGGVAAGVLGLLFARLWSMQLVSADEYAEQADLNRLRTVTTAAPRGRILDRNGTELVTNRPSLAVVADAEAAENTREMRLLANVIGMPEAAVRRNIQDTTEGAQSRRTVAQDVSRQAVAYIQEHPDLFPDVRIEERSLRHYPYGTLAAHVLGYTGPVTSDQLEAQGTDPSGIAYESGDVVGQAGVEYQYENVLQGIRGERNVFVDADGNLTGIDSEIPASSGSDVVLTIDAAIQRAAEEGLAMAIERGTKGGGETPGTEVRRGACLALDATNGDVLAMASAPTFSPSVFVGGIGTEDWESLNDDRSGYPLLNRCISGTYPSASTIKPLSTFCALDEGIATTKSSFYCPGFWTGFGEASGQYCWEHAGHGQIDLREGIVYSCDSVFYEIGKAIFYSDNREALQQTFSKWHLGELAGIDLPSEEAGRIPTAKWKWDYFDTYVEDARTWRGGDTTNLVIGQGDLLVTPLQMAQVYLAIANGGQMWRPHVLKEIRGADGTGSLIGYEPQATTMEESADNLAFVRDALKGVIYEEDEAMASHFSNLPVSVAGKTGTAERQGKEPTGWFIAYAPAEDPKYVVCAVVEEGGFGSTCAMYAVREVLGAIYDCPDTSDAVSSQGVR